MIFRNALFARLMKSSVIRDLHFGMHCNMHILGNNSILHITTLDALCIHTLQGIAFKLMRSL